MTQKEYEAEIKALQVEQNAVYATIDQRIKDNAIAMREQLEKLSAVKIAIATLKAERTDIEREKNDIARRYNIRRAELRNERNNSIEPKEVSTTIAWELHIMVESALKEALAPIFGGGSDIERVKCNYHYDDEGRVSFEVVIPKVK